MLMGAYDSTSDTSLNKATTVLRILGLPHCWAYRLCQQCLHASLTGRRAGAHELAVLCSCGLDAWRWQAS